MSEFNIDLTINTEPIEININDEIITLNIPAGDFIQQIISGIQNTFIYQLSQVDIDNKYIYVSPLTNVQDKSKIIMLIQNASFIPEYLIDYSIDNDGKINWENLGLEDKLQVGDIIKIYF